MPWRGWPVELVPRKQIGIEVRQRRAVEFRRVTSELDKMRGDELVGRDTGARVMGTGSGIAETRQYRLPIKGNRIVAPDQDLGERHDIWKHPYEGVVHPHRRRPRDREPLRPKVPGRATIREVAA